MRIIYYSKGAAPLLEDCLSSVVEFILNETLRACLIEQMEIDVA
jgi:hypothetical protein